MYTLAFVLWVISMFAFTGYCILYKSLPFTLVVLASMVLITLYLGDEVIKK